MIKCILRHDYHTKIEGQSSQHVYTVKPWYLCSQNVCFPIIYVIFVQSRLFSYHFGGNSSCKIYVNNWFYYIWINCSKTPPYCDWYVLFGEDPIQDEFLLHTNVHYSRPTVNAPNLFQKNRALSKHYISVRICVNFVQFFPVGYFYNYVIGDWVCKYYEST
jgi:hypothetical protein